MALDSESRLDDPAHAPAAQPRRRKGAFSLLSKSLPEKAADPVEPEQKEEPEQTGVEKRELQPAQPEEGAGRPEQLPPAPTEEEPVKEEPVKEEPVKEELSQVDRIERGARRPEPVHLEATAEAEGNSVAPAASHPRSGADLEPPPAGPEEAPPLAQPAAKPARRRGLFSSLAGALPEKQAGDVRDDGAAQPAAGAAEDQPPRSPAVERQERPVQLPPDLEGEERGAVQSPVQQDEPQQMPSNLPSETVDDDTAPPARPPHEGAEGSPLPAAGVEAQAAPKPARRRGAFSSSVKEDPAPPQVSRAAAADGPDAGPPPDRGEPTPEAEKGGEPSMAEEARPRAARGEPQPEVAEEREPSMAERLEREALPTEEPTQQWKPPVAQQRRREAMEPQRGQEPGGGFVSLDELFKQLDEDSDNEASGRKPAARKAPARPRPAPEPAKKPPPEKPREGPSLEELRKQYEDEVAAKRREEERKPLDEMKRQHQARAAARAAAKAPVHVPVVTELSESEVSAGAGATPPLAGPLYEDDDGDLAHGFFDEKEPGRLVDVSAGLIRHEAWPL